MTTGVRRRLGVEERRQQLIGVALELFSRRSPDEVSIDEIASAAGISRPLVYHYFPGKLSLYEAALKRASDDLAARFVEPHEGPLGARLLRVMRRFFDFVDEHGPGFSALMRGGPAVGSSTTNALIDSVRQAAYVQILSHLGVTDPPARLELVVRSWISLAESTALIWLDGRRIPRAELEVQLVHDFAALTAVSAAHDAEMAALLRASPRWPRTAASDGGRRARCPRWPAGPAHGGPYDGLDLLRLGGHGQIGVAARFQFRHRSPGRGRGGGEVHDGQRGHGGRARTRRHSSKPLMSGRPTSTRATSGRVPSRSRTSSSTSASPPLATGTTWWPARASTAPMAYRLAATSSTTSTVVPEVCCVPLPYISTAPRAYVGGQTAGRGLRHPT
ncbi:HTH-type transcriptional regulator BetI [Streptomyces violarus]